MYVVRGRIKDSKEIHYVTKVCIISKNKIDRDFKSLEYILLNKEDAKGVFKGVELKAFEHNFKDIALVQVTDKPPYIEYAVLDYKEFNT